MSDIFSLKDLSDIPESLKQQITDKDTPQKKLLDLFLVAQRPLNISECLLGYYRKYEIEMSRNAMVGMLYKMAKNGLIVQTGKKGQYKLSNQPPTVERGRG